MSKMIVICNKKILNTVTSAVETHNYMNKYHLDWFNMDWKNIPNIKQHTIAKKCLQSIVHLKLSQKPLNNVCDEISTQPD